MANEDAIAVMDDDINEALSDAVCDGEGRVTALNVRHHLEKRGLRIVAGSVPAESFKVDPAHVETVKQALRVHGGNPPGLRQAAEYMERLEKRIKELESLT
jgi:hypothetical protein